MMALYEQQHGNETWTVSPKDMCRLERNKAGMLIWMQKCQLTCKTGCKHLERQVEHKSRQMWCAREMAALVWSCDVDGLGQLCKEEPMSNCGRNLS